MLKINETNKITFVLDVEGTASKPSVQCVLGADPELVFKAEQLFERNYTCNITVPNTMSPGMVPFKIQAIVNGKLFTPISMMIELQTADTVLPTPAPAPEEKPVEPQPEKNVEAAVDELLSFLKTVSTAPAQVPAPAPSVEEQIQEPTKTIHIDVAELFSTPITVERKQIQEVKIPPPPSTNALKQTVVKSLFNPKLKDKKK